MLLEPCALNLTDDGLRASAAAFGWALTEAEMGEIDALPSPRGYPTLFSSPGCPDSFFTVPSLVGFLATR